MSIEHRAHRRYVAEVAAEVSVGPEVVVAATQNVSVGGVGLLSDQPLPEGAEVKLVLFLTQDGIEDPDEEPFEVSASIAWSTENDAGAHLAGVRFGALTEAQRGQLERFVSAIG